MGDKYHQVGDTVGLNDGPPSVTDQVQHCLTSVIYENR